MKKSIKKQKRINRERFLIAFLIGAGLIGARAFFDSSYGLTSPERELAIIIMILITFYMDKLLWACGVGD